MKNVASTRELRDAFALFATGVTIMTARRHGGEPVGVTANSFTSVSLDPPLVSWCLQNDSTSFDAFSTGRPFAVNILRRDQEREAMHFARRAAVKFPDSAHAQSANDLPRIESAIGRLECRVEAQYAAGDHTIILGHVDGVEIGAGEPLVFYAGVFGRFQAQAHARHVEAWETFRGDWF